ncbi:uncharacterized protein Z520_06253 [Fonsecaea multimorphosa CBS 102226]|uniref:Uncharacterized protein n=1 Tax=Fonsecaea multimorphosa CBS 102226 TaxID=1442371 RepID=A0A0D2KN71_9EURO|nr:uncharacterized protein Z520_06253 [Fonsecaea multimorphosa CBS 102226]KIX98173.1 hypothetical protein Z520_06253 [Fonsecaea multimorphosa CBS 102226]OAL24248.1 hypothetical protein AYO22_05908 [Fonsecaea multimorphosa]
MAQPKGFTIFARASSASPPRKSYMQSIPSMPRSEDEESIDCSSSSDGTHTPSSVASSTTTAVSITSAPSTDTVRTKPATRGKMDFSILEDLFAPETTTEETPSSSPLWYILTTALLLAFHKEKLIGELWTYLSRREREAYDAHDRETGDLLAIARRIREACLKASTLVGFPRAINALLALQQALKTTHPTLSTILESDPSLRATTTTTTSPASDPSAKAARGMRLFQRIYAQHTPRVLSSMSACSGGDLTHFAINCIYGELLAESSIIGDLETGLLEFVCCLADGCAPQAKGHFFGSVNLGAGRGTLRATVRLTDEVARQVHAERPWRDEADEDEDEDRDPGEWRFLDRVMVE